jgi:hypothetical protein
MHVLPPLVHQALRRAQRVVPQPPTPDGDTDDEAEGRTRQAEPTTQDQTESEEEIQMTTFNNFADRFHIVPQARFDAKPREYIQLEIVEVSDWQWALKCVADVFRLPMLQR